MQLFHHIALIAVLTAIAVNADTSVVTLPGYTATGATVTFSERVSTVIVPPPADTTAAAGPGTTAATGPGTTAAGPAPPPGTTGTAAATSSISGRCFPISVTIDR